MYAAVVGKTPGGLVCGMLEAGDGALADELWAPSSVKVLARDGALAQLANVGFMWEAV